MAKYGEVGVDLEVERRGVGAEHVKVGLSGPCCYTARCSTESASNVNFLSILC